MKTQNKTTITVEATVKASVTHVWEIWTKPEHIMHWNFASDDWCCPAAENDPQPGGRFVWRMEAKDGSMGFDFTGTYEQVIAQKHIAYKMDDGRKATLDFTDLGNETIVTETFEAEASNSIDMQRTGWQAILDNFKKYAEDKNK